MIVFPCHVCRTDLSADESQAGQLVRCRNCLTTLRVPAAAPDPAAALAAMHAGPTPGGGYYPPQPQGQLQPQGYPQQQAYPQQPPQMMGGFYGQRPVGRRYGFNCGHCSSRLEATE